ANTSGGTVVVDGNRQDRVFDIGPLAPSQVSMADLAIQNGVLDPPAQSVGGGLRIGSGSTAALANVTVTQNGPRGIANSGTLTLTSSTISRNFSTAGEFGGGIYSTGALTMSQSTVSENRVSGFLVCGGIASSGAATITDSTIRGNSGGLRVGPSTASGGGICNLSSGAPGLLMTNST